MMVEVLVSVFQSEIKHFVMKFNFVLKTTFNFVKTILTVNQHIFRLSSIWEFQKVKIFAMILFCEFTITCTSTIVMKVLTRQKRPAIHHMFRWRQKRFIAK